MLFFACALSFATFAELEHVAALTWLQKLRLAGCGPPKRLCCLIGFHFHPSSFWCGNEHCEENNASRHDPKLALLRAETPHLTYHSSPAPIALPPTQCRTLTP